MRPDEFLLILVPSKDDAPPFSDEYQAELGGFAKDAHATSQYGFAMDSAAGGGGPVGEFIFDAAAVTALIRCLGTICTEWIKARHGRKLRLKSGDVEVQATTVEEIEAMVKLAKGHQAKKKKPSSAE
jgi:hypothetical protein